MVNLEIQSLQQNVLVCDVGLAMGGGIVMIVRQ